MQSFIKNLVFTISSVVCNKNSLYLTANKKQRSMVHIAIRTKHLSADILITISGANITEILFQREKRQCQM